MINRSAHTLLELVISMAAASVLLAGLAMSVFIAVEASDGQLNIVVATDAAGVQADMVRDVSRATAFTVRDKETITFTVPDENGDGVEENVTYAYDKDADTLSLTFNGATATLLTGVTDSIFEFLERDVTGGAPTPTPYDKDDWGTRWLGLMFESFKDESKKDATELKVKTPDQTAAGDLLITAVVCDNNDPIVPPGGEGWTEIAQATHSGTALQLGVWWKIAGASEPSEHIFTQLDDEDMYGWMMRFTGHDPVSPINASSGIVVGVSSSPISPGVTTTVDNALVLRIGGFDDNDITKGEPGLSDCTTITMDESDGSGTNCAGGGGYVFQPDAGSSGTSNFSLTDSEQYLTITIAIAPK